MDSILYRLKHPIIGQRLGEKVNKMLKTVVPTSASENMYQYCSSCRHVIPSLADWKYCPYCGESLS